MRRLSILILSAVLRCTAALAAPVSAADPLAGATLAVFDDGAVRQVDLGAAQSATMIVFSDDGAREVALPSAAHGAGSDPTVLPGRGDTGYLRLSTGYRRDETSFNIASDASGDATPNVISELSWTLPAAQIRLDAGWTHASGFALRGHLAYARALAGTVQDSDYALDDRQAEFSRSYSDPAGSSAYAYSLGVGWRFALTRDADLTALIGAARTRASYRMRDGDQVIPALGAFAGLDSRYEPDWRSGWLGFDVDARPDPRLVVRTGLKYHWFSYQAQADWNLRGDFAHPLSFRQSGNGAGWEADFGADWALASHHFVSLDVSAAQLRLKDGDNVFHSADGTTSTQRLNGVTSDSWGVRLGYRYAY